MTNREKVEDLYKGSTYTPPAHWPPAKPHRNIDEEIAWRKWTAEKYKEREAKLAAAGPKPFLLQAVPMWLFLGCNLFAMLSIVALTIAVLMIAGRPAKEFPTQWEIRTIPGGLPPITSYFKN